MNTPQTFAIEIQNVKKKYRAANFKTSFALNEVNLAIPKGEIFGFLGPNGAGKTSLIKILVGIMSPDTGYCKIMGHQNTSTQAKLKIGYLPERPYFHDFLTAREFLHFHGGLLGFTEEQVDAKIPALLERVGLKRAVDQRLRTFSKGMLQRTGLAQALIHNPDVLILDEPMSGLDPVGRREVREIISDIANDGKTIFFSTHIIHDVEVICTTVGFITDGTLKGAGNIEQLLGKTVASIELRFSLPGNKEPKSIPHLASAKPTMDGYVLTLENDAAALEELVDETVKTILSEKGRVRSVVPRKSTLEDLFFV